MNASDDGTTYARVVTGEIFLVVQASDYPTSDIRFHAKVKPSEAKVG